MPIKPTFGAVLRAARYGYHFVEGIGFVRILACGPPHEIHVLPLDFTSDMPSMHPFVVWWETCDSRRIIVDAIRKIVVHHFPNDAAATKPLTFFLDDNGIQVEHTKETY